MGARMLRRARVAVTGAYTAQGLGYAVVVTSLPALKERQQIDDTVVSLIVLGVCVAAAVGSFLANAVSVRSGSRAALVLGLVLQAAALPLVAVSSAPVPFFSAFALYGVGLGCVDAASAMQGVAVQRAHGSPLLGGFFAAYTAAAIAGALLVAGATAAVPGEAATAVAIVLAVAAAWALAVGVGGIRAFAADAPAAASGERRALGGLPARGIWAFGFVILAVFVADSAVSTWSTVYLHDDLGVLAWGAPLGYGVYQATVLITRLTTDLLLRRLGPRRLVVVTVVIATAGCLAVAVLPSVGAAIVGFALVGVATGALVPAAFGAAGELDPARSDEVIARVNVFNYVGAVVGAVAVGLLAEGPGLAVGFLIPAAMLALVLLMARVFHPRVAAPAPAPRRR